MSTFARASRARRAGNFTESEVQTTAGSANRALVRAGRVREVALAQRLDLSEHYRFINTKSHGFLEQATFFDARHAAAGHDFRFRISQ